MTTESPSPEILFDTSSQTVQATGQCDCACDCACAQSSPSDMPGDTFGATVDLLRQTDSVYTSPLDDEHTLAFNARSDVGPVVLNQPALEIWDAFTTPTSLMCVAGKLAEWSPATVKGAGRALMEAGLIRPATCPFPCPTSRSKLLVAWLHITDRCPLRCAYCYLPHDPQDMSPTVGRAAIDATFRSALVHGYRRIKLKYAGGEPLLRLSTILKLHRYAEELAARHNIELDGVVLSSGVLLNDESVRSLQDTGLRLMVSLDGLGDAHDAQRPFADGKGSFTAVARGIDLAMRRNLTPDISVTVSGRNADGLPELVGWLLKRDLPFSINFYRENSHSTLYADLQLERKKIITGVLGAYRVIEENLPPRGLLTSLIDRANLARPHLHTCSAGHSYLVFTPRGDVAKCQMDMRHTVADCRTLDPLTAIRQSPIGLRNLSVEEKDRCRDCLWRYQCSGGCPLQAHSATGSYGASSPNCDIYKRLIPEVMKLEGLRLLRYA